MQVRIDQIDETCVIRLSGEVDRSDCNAFRSALRNLIDGGQWRIGLDLSAVTFFDSSGVPGVVHALQDLPSNVGCQIVAASQMTRRVFAVLGYGALLPTDEVRPEVGNVLRRRLFDTCGRSA